MPFAVKDIKMITELEMRKNQVNRLQQENERLEDALATCRELRKWDRSAVIEECARVAETHYAGLTRQVGKAIAAAIRALKDKP